MARERRAERAAVGAVAVAAAALVLAAPAAGREFPEGFLWGTANAVRDVTDGTTG